MSPTREPWAHYALSNQIRSTNSCPTAKGVHVFSRRRISQSESGHTHYAHRGSGGPTAGGVHVFSRRRISQSESGHTHYAHRGSRVGWNSKRFRKAVDAYWLPRSA